MTDAAPAGPPPCQLSVTRIRKGYQDRLRRYKIVVDGWTLGLVSYGKTWTGQIVPGAHKVTMTIDWKTSPDLEITAASGGVVLLECGPGANVVGGVNQLTGPDHAYLYIRQLT
jgi:hypothetical protein